jgi:hypothetical protein
MHLCFVDESRTPSKPDLSGSEYFVIGGVVIPEEKWKDIADKLKGLKRSEQYKGELKWRFFASPDRINFSMSASVFGAWVQCAFEPISSQAGWAKNSRVVRNASMNSTISARSSR